jgi:hypothetical protein
MSRIIVSVVSLSLVVLVVTGCGRDPAERAQRARRNLERELARSGLVLMVVPVEIRDEDAAVSVSFDRSTLTNHQLYLREPGEKGAFLFLDSSGKVNDGSQTPGAVLKQGELLRTAESLTLFGDGRPVRDVTGWEVFWVGTEEGGRPALSLVSIPRVEVSDGFMREQLQGDLCRVTTGTWTLAQHGGGMPTNAAEERSYDFQRAVNPFTVLGHGPGLLSYGSDQVPWTHYRCGGRFYFGVPRTAGHVVDVDTVPTATDMCVVQGSSEGLQVAFGWRGAERAFVIMTRDSGSPWETAAVWDGGQRPPLTNWIRLDLDVADGYRARGYLDGRQILAVDLEKRVHGPFHIWCGYEPMEFDDVRAQTLTLPEARLQPVFVQSRNFAGKREKDNSDPVQFGEWAQSTSTFVNSRHALDGDRHLTMITTGMPMMGDFVYEALPAAAEAGDLPQGPYRFDLRRADLENALRPQMNESVFSFMATYSVDEGWRNSTLDPRVWPLDRALPFLRIRRAEHDQGRPALFVDGHWLPVSDTPLPEQVYVSVSRVSEGRAYLRFPRPEHHQLQCANLVNEFFEEAPVDWSFVEGAFRMSARWACQDQWNFMACGGTGVPYMTSKRSFGGAQVHEYFMSMRPVLPWDAGDTEFEYDADVDRRNNLRVFHANGGWYVRRDLNFSFCTNGRDPLSGYAVVFGGNDNSETLLLRKGEVVARTEDPFFRFPGGTGHGEVHWKWWKFTVRKDGERVLVHMNDAPLFDYLDPEPLAEGHIGFWTVRNGFCLSRAWSLAEEIDYVPDVLYVGDDTAGTGWEPLIRDEVTLTPEPDSGLTRVTANVGAGFHGVRYRLEEPVDLARTPILELPLQLDDKAVVNVHVQIGKRACLIQVNGPLNEVKSLLTPAYESGECFRIPTLPPRYLERSRVLAEVDSSTGLLRVNLWRGLAELRGASTEPELTSISVGNTSNEGYLLAGSGDRNVAGTVYRVGEPRFLADAVE